MLIYFPILIFFSASLALLALRWLRPKFAYSWLIAALASLLAWLMMGVYRIFLPQQAVLPMWKPEDIFVTSPALRLDGISWPYAFAIVTLVFAVLLTSTARAQLGQDRAAWVGSLMLGGLGLFGVLAANPLTLLLAWAAVDLVELVILLSSIQSPVLSIRTVIGFAAQTLGGFFVLWALVSSRTKGINLDFSAVPDGAGIFLLLGAGLRLGVLPLHLPFSKEPHMRRGVGTLLRMIPVASSLMLLARLPEHIVPDAWAPLLVGLTSLAALYTAVMWATTRDEIEGRPYWIIALAANAVICVIAGYPKDSLAWGIALLFSGSLLFLYSARGRRLSIFWVFGLWGLSGLPFSQAASGWQGLLGGPLPGYNPIFLISGILLAFGYIRHAVRAQDNLMEMERWVQAIYPVGLLAILISQVLMGIWGWKGSLSAGEWWAGGAVTIIAGLSAFWHLRRGRSHKIFNATMAVSGWVLPLGQRVLNGITMFFRLEWIYQLLWLGFRGLQRLVGVLMTIFEGDGGVLWAVLLLTLVISLMQTRLTP